MNTALDVMKMTILLTVWLVMISALSFPTEFGRWLQKIDNGRFEHLDCDCTDALEDNI
jgi:hypothetical protein